MRNIQESIISMLREHSTRKHLAVAVCMIAIATAFAVFWSLRLSGLTLASEDPICGMQEHTHTDACYDWVATATDGTEEIEETESTEVDEETETTETEDETDEASTESETAEVFESASEEENTSLAKETESMESVTEETDEDVTEEATENVTEEVTEEETEAPQPGDTKVVDGVTYVYELVCGMEEHTHTDECYESDDSEEDADVAEETDADDGKLALTAGVATVSSYGISVASDESGIATVADEEEETITTSESYYFADSTTLATAAENQDESYIVYTIIDGSYYVVSAEDELIACNYLESSSDTTDGDGIYYWFDSSDNPVFKCVSDGSTVDFADYIWTLSGSASNDSTGTGTYTIYNSENSVYLAPQDVGVSETLVGTNWWNANETGKDYYLYSNQMLIFTIYCADGISGDAAFNVELYDNTTYPENAHYLTTGSIGDAWFADASQTNDYIGVGTIYGTLETTSADVATGTTYIVTVARTDSTSASTYTITYYNQTTGETHAEIVAEETDLVGDPVNVHIIAQKGTFKISAVYAVSKSVADTENDADSVSKNSLALREVTSSIKSLTDDSSITDDEGNVTYYKTGELVGDASLAGDFDVTYSFTNYGNNYSGHHDQNYVLAIYNSDGTEWIYMQPNYTTSTYASGAYTWIPEMEGNNASNATVSSYVNGVSTYEPDSTTWRSWMNQASGTTCSVNIVRQKNVITVTTTLYRNNTAFYSYVTKIIDSAFDDAAVQIYLTAVNANINGLTITDKSNGYDVTGYDSYSAVGTYNTSLMLTGTENGSISLTTATSKFLDSVTLSADNASSMSFAKSEGANTTFYLAKVRETFVWFDGTNGGMDSYLANSSVTAYDEVESIPYDAEGNLTSITTPTAAEVTDSSGYGTTTNGGYTLRGWYDIYSGKYYKPGEKVTLSSSTVMYADWEVSSYNIADDRESDSVVSTVSTNNFITTRLFDYNELFNAQSEMLLDSVSRTDSTSGSKMTEYRTLTLSGHRELFNLSSSSSIALGSSSLGFLFFRTETYPFYYTDLGKTVSGNDPLIDYPDGRGGANGSSTKATTEILGSYGTRTTDESAATLLTTLFATDNTVADVDDSSSESFVLGKTYVGTADYLFQYDSATGYYHYNSELNAATYYADEERFYVYNYIVKANTGGSNASTDDFLPFNYGTSGESISMNNINYWFGMSTEIEFYLPDDVPAADSESNGKVNLAIDNSHHMTFKFSGDDDVWVFVDGVLVLDLGGVHGQVYGEIDFSTGEVTVVNTVNDTTITLDDWNDDGTGDVLNYTESAVTEEQKDAETYVRSLKSGTHTLTFYYLERGASQSNAAIYFNIASTTYNLNLSKVDEEDTDKSLEGAEFTFYTDSAFTTEAELLKEKNGTTTYGTFASTDTVYGLREGVTYYVVETKAPDGYGAEGKYFTILLNSDVLTVTVYATGNDDPQELYTYKITYNSDGTCTYTLTYADTATGTDVSTWDYVLANLASFSASLSSSGSVEYYTIGLTIANAAGYELPTTGSMGIFPYKRAGTVLVLVSITGLLITAFYHLVWVRKLRTSGNNKGYTEEKENCGKRFARTRDHPRERSGVHGRDAPAVTFADRGKERSRGTGPGTE